MQTQPLCMILNEATGITPRKGQQCPTSRAVRSRTVMLAWAGNQSSHCSHPVGQQPSTGPEYSFRSRQLQQQQQQQQQQEIPLLPRQNALQQQSNLSCQQQPPPRIPQGRQQQQQWQRVPVPASLDVLLQQCSNSLQQRQLLLMLQSCDSSNSSSSGGSSSGPKPESAAGSGAPPRQTAGTSAEPTAATVGDAAGNPDTAAAQQQQQQQPEQQQQQPEHQQSQQQLNAADSMGETELEAAVDKMLDRTWQELKRDLKKEMSPEQAAMIDSWNLSDIQTDKVFRDIAEQQLGPILELMGIREDPYEFFIDMFKLALGLQLGSAALVFYGAELGLGLDAGDGFRAVAGLALGYFLRLGIKIEHLAWPLYNAFVQLLIREDAVYEYPPATADERRDTLNKLGLVIASAFFVPKLLFGWQNDECWQIVVPMVGGLFFFDVCYILALLIKLWGHEDRQ